MNNHAESLKTFSTSDASNTVEKKSIFKALAMVGAEQAGAASLSYRPESLALDRR